MRLIFKSLEKERKKGRIHLKCCRDYKETCNAF